MRANQSFTCKRCLQIRCASDMKRDTRNKSGFSSYCKGCHQAASVAWQAANPEKVNATRRARYERKKAAGQLPPRAYDREAVRWSNLRRFYGVTQQQYESMLQSQGGACAICLRPANLFNRPLAVDHRHGCCPSTPTCGRCNRGLLCALCNSALHNIERDSGWVDRASAYINRSQ